MVKKPVSILIMAPVIEVFDFVNDDANFSRLYPHAVDHREIEPLPGGGHNCVQVFKFPSGANVTARSTCLSFDAPWSMSHRAELDIGGSWVQMLTFQAVDNGTDLTMTVEVEVPTRAAPRRFGQRQWLGMIRNEFEKARGGE